MIVSEPHEAMIGGGGGGGGAKKIKIDFGEMVDIRKRPFKALRYQKL